MVKRSRIVAFFLIVILLAGVFGGTTKQIVNKIKLGLDLQGGFEVLYDVQPAVKGQKIDRAALSNTVDTLQRRVNSLGVNEPNIQIEGNNRIRVQLAGVKNQNEARNILSTQANLSFRDVNDKELMNGSDLVQGKAKQSFTQNGDPNVVLQLKDRNKFRSVTQKIVKMAPNNKLVIWMDFVPGKDSYKKEVTKKNPKFLSDPNVNEVFNTDTVTIEGNFSLKEAQNLASLLDAGALPVKLKEVYSTSVGAKFGAEALHDTVTAGIVGIVIIFLFMIAYYRLPGLIASVSLTIYVYLILLIFYLIHGVLTLPGIAALILGVGMAVDANIITYERIKEEIKVGKSINSAFKAGNKTSLIAILDANVTTLIAGIVLFIYGTSSVKGFATLLIISILLSFLTAVYGSRMLLGLWVNSKALKNKPGWFGVKKSAIHSLSENFDTLDLPTRFDRFDFVKHRNIFFAISAILVIAGLIICFVFKLNLGTDYTSGTRVQVNSSQTLTNAKLTSDFKALGLQPDDIELAGNHSDTGVVRLKGMLSKSDVEKVNSHFTSEYGTEPSISTVSPTVGKELAKNAISALIIAAVGIIIYVALRFEVLMGLATIVALFYDVFFIIAIFSLTRLEVDLNFIAAVLTIAGYSINDTIVTFDRIRENLRKKGRIKTEDELADVVNKSIRQTLTRSVNTVLTVVITTLAILIFGSSSLTNFAIALLIGLISGTYSSIFIASQLWFVWKRKQLRKNGPIKTVKEKRKWSDEPQV
ncbi:protein translocase subunit SecDF [Heyndrickxia acidicola]|uniref:Multifunctional fusion protein n=1 Tax=Heyndrickxia acidicola TaxID=209389 RepID=A0ABU6MK44_9BACI|nr:protein translocase subunit SecDF [Heyndrickxia acidicola]MED1204757.1 protein translocase subunit SecDF [Heyndrickxia acidicola]